MRFGYFLFIIIIIVSVSCVSGPKNLTEQETVSTETQEDTAVFSAANISQETYDSTMVDVQRFVEELNRLIRMSNYDAWVAALSKEYFEEISSPETLRRASESNAMRTRNITIRNAHDYFINIVVPANSRVNHRVDEIEFLSETRVMVYSLRTNREGVTEKLLLYDLEKIDNTWKIN